MNNKRRFKFSEVGVAALTAILVASMAFLAFQPATAQQYNFYQPTTAISGGTNNVAAFSTNTYSISHSTTLSEYVPILLRCRTDQTNGAQINLRFQKSVDGEIFDTIDPIVITLAGSTNAGDGGWIGLTTNLFVGGIRAIRLFSAGNIGAGAATNLTVQLGTKR